MKYIRTKDYDLILQVSDKITDKYGTYYLYDNDTKWFEDKVAKVADTIEELCDEFVCVRRRDNKHYNTEDKKIFDYWYLDKGFVNCDWYCAIWTNKGLIYVAKLDDEGWWELL